MTAAGEHVALGLSRGRGRRQAIVLVGVGAAALLAVGALLDTGSVAWPFAGSGRTGADAPSGQGTAARGPAGAANADGAADTAAASSGRGGDAPQGGVLGSLSSTPATYQVASWGSDGADGSEAHPWRTIQKAVDSVGPGATIQVRSGTYAGATITRSGYPGAPITLTAYPGDRPTVAGDGSHPKVIRIAGAHDIVVAGLTISGAPDQWGAGIYVENGATNIAIHQNVLRSNHSFGIKLAGVSHVSIENNDITDNDTGIEVSGGGEAVLVAANRIYNNDHMVVNTPAPGGDRGANGIVLTGTSGHIVITGNEIYGNRAKSYDYGFDGGAFEIYAASNITISDNVMWDNQNVLETGTGGATCANNQFIRNIAYAGPGAASVPGPIEGLILRCATDMLVANNTFSGLQRFTFDVSAGGSFAGGIGGLRILNNIALSAGDKVYSIDSAMPASVTIDHDLVDNPSGQAIAWVAGRGTTSSLSTFTSWTGFDRSGIQSKPGFASGSFNLTAGSPAIDRGIAIPGVTGGFAGQAPDIGRFEFAASVGAAPRQAPAVVINERSSSITYHGHWISIRYAGYLGGGANASPQDGATASLTFTGHAIRVFGPRGPGRGRVQFLVDGNIVATVDLTASRFTARTVLFRWTAPAPGTHQVTFRVVGASGRLATLDAFVVSP